MKRMRPLRKRFPLPKKYWAYVATCVLIFLLAFVVLFVLIDFERKNTDLPWYAPFIFIFTDITIMLLAVPFALKGGEIYKKSIVQRQIEYYSRFKYVSIKPEDYDHIWFDYIYSERLLINAIDGKYLVHYQVFDCDDERWIERLPEGEWYDSWEELKLDWIDDYGFINNDIKDD